MAKIETTAKEFRAGIAAKAGDEIRWISTGHLSVRLLDASGSHPLAARTVTVEIPGEGSVSFETDDDGELFHPDVPFQDYELDVGGVKVSVPTVGDRNEVHERHVSAAPLGFVQAVLYDAFGRLVAGAKVQVQFASGAVVEANTDESGVLRCHHVDPGDGEVMLRFDDGRCTTKAMASPQKVARLTVEKESR
ncbi:MAG: hypothetical protein ACTHU0_28805 [Kofleriaceae bacterium]